MKDFDVAISFAGEDREVARKLAEELTRLGLKVFYDDYEQAKLLGETLTEYLIDIYKNKASYCVVLVSKHYVVKRWTRHEWKAAQARAFEEYERSYILPVRIDSTELPGLLPTIGYLSLEKNSIENISKIILDKSLDQSEFNKSLRIANSAYKNSKYNEAIRILEHSDYKEKLFNNPDGLRLLADCYLIVERTEEALDLFYRIKELRPESADNWFIIGVCLFRLGKFEKAERYYKKAIEINPAHFTAHLDLNSIKRLKWMLKVPFIGSLIEKFRPDKVTQKQLLNMNKNID